jgi:hypothetical protein
MGAVAAAVMSLRGFTQNPPRPAGEGQTCVNRIGVSARFFTRAPPATPGAFLRSAA